MVSWFRENFYEQKNIEAQRSSQKETEWTKKLITT